ncbi:MAG: diguanylate cyclase [Ignavibacteriae bacterium HGW-Ignavibacteriae-2]|jgi:diguanylate cyclase (GGDEF)-like protein|nr:MAG: diguanylate cyclase [Ignavibacteriae bacterium HGW-Ignavibacteriae-2]
MPFINRNRKRFLTFLLIPLLSAVQFFTEDFILNVIAAVLLIVYVAFIIFLRDSIREGDIPYKDEYEEDSELDAEEGEEKLYETDYGEEFKIISPNKKIEVSKAGDIRAGSSIGGKNYFKPPDLKENFVRIANEKLPENIGHDEHFSFILEKILSVIKEAYMAHATLFFWYNKRKNKIALESYASGSTDIILQKFDVEDDILSKIVLKEEPELLTDIPENAEKDVIRYYSKPQGIKSFIGVPLYYNEQLSAVLAIDSKVIDAFGIETIYSLGRFVRVISSIISLFDEKFSNTQSEERLKSLLGILSANKKFETEEELNNIVETSIKSLLQWDVFAFITFSAGDNKFKISKVTNNTSLKYVGEYSEIDLNDTLTGKCILTGLPVKVDDTAENEVPRYTKNEGITFDGSFLAIPLTYDEQNFGVLCFESLKKNSYTNSDIEFLKKATKIFAYIVYSYSSQSLLRSLLTNDVETKFLNQNAFISSLKTELEKSAFMEIPGALVLIQIDAFLEEGSLFEGDPFPKVLKSIVQIIREETNKFNIIARLGDKLFGIYFFNTPIKETFLWAEKLRIKIARKPIAVATKQTTFTVSIGIANTTNKTDVEEVMYDAELALNKSIEKGGNTVKSI